MSDYCVRKMNSIDECKSILECAIGECEEIIPSKVLQDTIAHLERHQELVIESSWNRCPERMGR